MNFLLIKTSNKSFEFKNHSNIMELNRKVLTFIKYLLNTCNDNDNNNKKKKMKNKLIKNDNNNKKKMKNKLIKNELKSESVCRRKAGHSRLLQSSSLSLLVVSSRMTGEGLGGGRLNCWGPGM